MHNHDFKQGDKVCMLDDPTFRQDTVRILTGEVVCKWTSPRGDEFSYTILLDNSGGLRSGVPGIFVYGSLNDLREIITKGIEGAVDDADREVNRLFKKLEKAQQIQKPLRQLHREWMQGLKGPAADTQTKET